MEFIRADKLMEKLDKMTSAEVIAEEIVISLERQIKNDHARRSDIISALAIAQQYFTVRAADEFIKLTKGE